jgi:hypothetical protein
VTAVWRRPSAPSMRERVRSTASGHSWTYVLGVTIGLLCPSESCTALTEARPEICHDESHGGPAPQCPFAEPVSVSRTWRRTYVSSFQRVAAYQVITAVVVISTIEKYT